MKLPKKIVSLLTVTLVAGSGLGNLATVDAAEGVSSETLKGNGRWETAIEISKKGWTKAKEAVIVNDNSLADALTATPFAEAIDAPILLTQNNKLDDRTKAELKRLGVTKVYLIGGESSLNKSVESALNSEKISTDRIWGNTRYETSLELAKKLDNIKKVSEISVANGQKGIVDAISIAPVAAEKDMPIILVSPSKGTEVADKFIAEKSIKSSYVIGGTNSVSNEVSSKLPNATRVEGKDRNETNAKVIETFYKEKELKNAYVAKNGMTKENELIDGLAVGVLAAKNDSPVLLVGKNLSQGQKDVTNTKTFKTITQVGGGSNEASFNELKTMQQVTTYNVSTVAKLNEAMAKADANDVINMAPAALNKAMAKGDANNTADINEEIVIKTNKAIEINLSGNYKNTITVSAPNASIVNKGTISKIVVKDSVGGKIENTSGSKIIDIEVQGSASNVEVVNKGTVTNVKNDASGTVINNSGTITNNPTGNQTPSIEGDRPGGSTGGGGGGSVEPPVTSADVKTEEQLIAAINDKNIKTIILKNTIELTDNLDGKNKVITVATDDTDDTDATKGHALLVKNTNDNNEEVNISKLTIENAKGFGIQYYNSKGKISDVTIKNSAKGGLLVNGSTVEATNLVTEGNEWYGVNVDKGEGVKEETSTSFTLDSTSILKEDIQIKYDNINDGVTVNAVGYIKTKIKDTTDNDKQYTIWNQKLPEGVYINDGSNIRTKYLDIHKALDALKDNDTIELSGTQKVSQQVKIVKPLTINGVNNAKIVAVETGFTGDKNPFNNLVSIEGTSNVKLNDIEVSSSKASGVHVYKSTDVTLNNIKLSNNTNAGLIVNGSTVEANGLVTELNKWYGVNIDKGEGVENETSFTLDNKSKLDEETQIKCDNYDDQIKVTLPDGYIKSDKVNNIVTWSNRNN
ncbi:cell wall-binding repeat-containing protein [Metaclostridioides mangenotii]|uniref:cell wall-binding repeat-containing protein n=1 Tax=Metaclostridioides mangenotii TaxID=1540 RepID=UPI0028EF7E5D|nr:cell wall-binding repeat-containing protein [Clostridioides mangenotii]